MMSRTIRRVIWSYAPMYQRNCLTVLVISLTAALTSSNPVCNSTTNGTECACEMQNLSISCTPGRIIRILGAHYGRLDNETCNDGNHKNYGSWNLTCSSPNSTNVIKDRCNNRTKCSFYSHNKDDVYNSLFGGDPCPTTGKYLIVNYTCRLENDTSTTSPVNRPTSPTVVTPVSRSVFTEESKSFSAALIVPATVEIAKVKNESEYLRTNFSIALTNELMSRVENISKRNELNGDNLFNLTHVMVELVELSENNNLNYTVTDAETLNELVIRSTSNLLSGAYNETWMELQPSDQSKTATRLLVAMEDSSAVLAKAIHSQNITRKSASGIEELKIDVINVTETTVKVVAFTASDSQFEISLEDISKRARDGLGRIVFILYNDIEKWLKTCESNDRTPKSRTNETVDGETRCESFIITKVLSASIIPHEEHSAKLEHPIRFTLRHKSEQTNSTKPRLPSCVFWKFSKTDFVGRWSSEGCRIVSTNKKNTTCECDHLTNFAVLMSAVEIPDEHSFPLQVISYIGCTISVVCLVLALCTFCFFRNLQSERNTIHKNLVLCLLIAELIFLFGIIPHNDNKLLCAFVAGFLHYFFLASFAWMCLEGAQLYVLLVEVFQREKSRVKWYYLGGYGIPALIVLISVSVNIYMTTHTKFDMKRFPYGGYGTEKYCWLGLESGFIWAFNGPVIAIFAVNSVMLGMAIYMMCKHASSTASWKVKEKSKIHAIGSWLRGAAILVVLLGTTWLFGLFLLFESNTVVMHYIFAILNSFQGLFIFVFHCLTNDKVQKEYQRAIQRSSWLPECVRVKYGDLSGSGALSTPNQSTSSGKTVFQRMFPKNNRKESLSRSSLLKLDSTSSEKGSWSRRISTTSKSAPLTDSPRSGSRESGFLVRFEDATGCRDPVGESKFDGSDKCESSSTADSSKVCVTYGRSLNLKDTK